MQQSVGILFANCWPIDLFVKDAYRIEAKTYTNLNLGQEVDQLQT
jgi:hypothetical protein